MIIDGNRTKLDTALNDTTTTLFVLVGPPGSKAELIHSTMEAKTWQPYQKYFLVTDATVLSNKEVAKWFDGDRSERYVVLGGKDVPKVVARKEPVSDLLKDDGTPDYLLIVDAFLEGDEV